MLSEIPSSIPSADIFYPSIPNEIHVLTLNEISCVWSKDTRKIVVEQELLLNTDMQNEFPIGLN